MDFCAGTGHKKDKEENISTFMGTTAWNNKGKNRNYPSPQNQ